MLLTGAADFVSAMGWEEDSVILLARKAGIERQMFPDLSEDEEKIVSLLRDNNDLNVNIIVMRTQLPSATVTSSLFSLELKGVVRMYAGGVYHLMD